MPRVREGNLQLAALITEASTTHAALARMVVRVASEVGAADLMQVGRSHISHWVGGSRPSGQAPEILREALSRLLGRVVTLTDVGLITPDPEDSQPPGWEVDTLAALADLGRQDVDPQRRKLLGAAAFSLAATRLPPAGWWAEMARQGPQRARGEGRGSRANVDNVREMTALFSRVDQRRGGGHARTAVSQYLASDVAAYLGLHYPSERDRRDMFTAASELAYLAGWMAFDNAEHSMAQRHFAISTKLAAEANDPAMAGHVLRAMAHQSLDLGHARRGLELATASVDGARYEQASNRERALLGVVQARAEAANGNRRAAVDALLRAEHDLAAADPGDDEPDRVFFFSEASLAHETAGTLRVLGDLKEAERQFKRSVKTRQAAAFTRTHAVTLGLLGSVQLMRGNVDEACATWDRSLNAMEGIRSGRTRQIATTIRASLAPLKNRSTTAAEIDERAATYLEDHPS
jgi:tetratricopeptide (TPR) repeat protein